MAAVHDTPDIGSRLDRLPLTWLHGWLVLVCTLAMTVTISEMSLSGALSAIFSSGANKASSGELSALLSSVYVGAVMGAPLFGRLADRIGRRGVLIGVLLWIAATSLAAGFTHDILQLTVCRGLSGLALGVLPPLVVSLLADVLPPKQRGVMTFWCIGLSTVGPFCTLMFLRAMATSTWHGGESWRLTFGVLALLCVLTAGAAALLPESPRFLAVRGRIAAAVQALGRFERARVLPWQGTTRRAMAAVAGLQQERPKHLVYALFALSPWATSSFPILSGAILTQRGFALNDALMVVSLSMVGPMAGNFVSSMSLDRIDRRHGLAACSVVLALSGATFVSSDVSWQVLTAATVFGMATSIYLSTLNLYAAELFPTEGRSRRLASAWALNRIGAAVAPLLLVPLLHDQGAEAMFAVVACTIVAALGLTYLSPRGRQRQAVT
ncbi:MFS transporter [Rhizobacter sp. OV335]|uniref:MFS transporter n=1 Tax=Rhizobacter sp. OV335 TaxID=1500264 RepID=UPI0009226BCC|nr:MFS transporter [Rhizobacter sp. OV335]SHM30852.1 MFS transporter, putative metabolite:H+ symporter [Rhizobacter sp. OV335]